MTSNWSENVANQISIIKNPKKDTNIIKINQEVVK